MEVAPVTLALFVALVGRIRQALCIRSDRAVKAVGEAIYHAVVNRFDTRRTATTVKVRRSIFPNAFVSVAAAIRYRYAHAHERLRDECEAIDAF